MANLWLWFPNAEERRQYVIELLGLNAGDTEAFEIQEEYLSSLEEGKTRSRWYGLEAKFYMNKTGKYQDQTLPFQELPVWEKGFRRIYTQNSYYFRPGFWLVLKLRDNVAGRLVRKHIDENFPAERLGTKVPLPKESEMFLELRRVKGLLCRYGERLHQGERKPKLLQTAYETAGEILENYPRLFRRDDDVGVLQTMAGYWEECGELEKAARCLDIQTRMQLRNTEAWLNLGAIYRKAKMWGPAVEAYLRGLRFSFAESELRSNLDKILGDEQAADEALDYMDSLVAKYPSPFNQLIAGDLLERLGMYQEAAARYARGARKAGPDNRIGLRCLTGLAKIYLADKDYAKARPVVEETLGYWGNDKICLEQAVELYSAEGDAKLKKVALRLVRRSPRSVAGHQALARCYLAEGDVVRAKEHVTRARELQSK